MLLSCELHASCSSSCCDVEYNVFITLLHMHTHKKNLHLCEACCRNEMGGSLHKFFK
jgi:hypothetical protein